MFTSGWETHQSGYFLVKLVMVSVRAGRYSDHTYGARKQARCDISVNIQAYTYDVFYSYTQCCLQSQVLYKNSIVYKFS